MSDKDIRASDANFHHHPCLVASGRPAGVESEDEMFMIRRTAHPPVAEGRRGSCSRLQVTHHRHLSGSRFFEIYTNLSLLHSLVAFFTFEWGAAGRRRAGGGG